MANSRIKDISTTAAAAASDDYLVIDGATNGTRKISVSNVGGKMYDFTSSLTPSIDSRGVTASYFYIAPSNSADVTVGNALKLQAYLANSATVSYPLILTHITVGSTKFTVQLKSIYGNPQNTTSTTVSGTLHIVAPFEISNVTASM